MYNIWEISDYRLTLLKSGFWTSVNSKNFVLAMPNLSCVLVSKTDMPGCCDFKPYAQRQAISTLWRFCNYLGDCSLFRLLLLAFLQAAEQGTACYTSLCNWHYYLIPKEMNLSPSTTSIPGWREIGSAMRIYWTQSSHCGFHFAGLGPLNSYGDWENVSTFSSHSFHQQEPSARGSVGRDWPKS